MYSTYEAGQGGDFTSPKDVPGCRILVCAVLMGMPLQVERARARRVEGLLSEDPQSHTSPDQYEYIVFDSAQIIPCYVLHCDYGAANARQEYEERTQDASYWSTKKTTKAPRAAPPPAEADESFFPAAVKEKKAEMKASAMEYFP